MNNRPSRRPPSADSRFFGSEDGPFADWPLEQPSADFTNKVMDAIGREFASGTPRMPEVPGKSAVRRRHAELIHGLVAAAATYIFMSSGLAKAVIGWQGAWISMNIYHWVSIAVDFGTITAGSMSRFIGGLIG